MTESAQVAKFIRADLKKRFPKYKFSVRSENFSGGDAVNIHYTMEHECYPTENKIYSIVNKYKAGSFDGMTDCYNYDCSKTGPTVKYITVQANTSLLQEKYKPVFLRFYGLTAFDDQEIRQKLGCWKEQALYQYIRKNVLVNAE